jgi:hypothetical protein
LVYGGVPRMLGMIALTQSKTGNQVIGITGKTEKEFLIT